MLYNTSKLDRSRKPLLLLLLALVCAGCSTTAQQPEVPPRYVGEAEPNGLSIIDEYDPLEGMNRYLYRFNAWFDEVLFLPVINSYDYLLPEMVKNGIHNFFANVGDFTTLVNGILQLRGGVVLDSSARIVVNSTIGVLGFMDQATDLGFVRHDEDFGQTLGYYGVGAGPYIVLPILGPSSLRDTTGFASDAVIFSTVDPLRFDDVDSAWEYSFLTLRTLDTRYQNHFRYYESGSPFEYELVRLLYLKMREAEIKK